MEDSKFEELKKEDKYLIDRKNTKETERYLYLREVDYTCPLCGKDLKNHKQKKGTTLYDIAHIYPNSPTKEQFINLKGVERLGENSESFENKIALCKDCHRIQDYHTSRDEYERLLSIKKQLLENTRLAEATFSINLEQEIATVVDQIANFEGDITTELNDLPVKVANKFYPKERLLKNKVKSCITLYYPYVQSLFKNLNGTKDFSFNSLCLRIKSCYEQMKIITTNKEPIFENFVKFFMKQTQSQSREACEIVVSFFIQNCEVFDEITK